jgi:organic radical activating enzyme
MYIRTQGCNVGCDWCDSYYTWKPHNQEKVPPTIVSTPKEVSFSELYEKIVNANAAHVWFTGGEPTLQAEAIYKFLIQRSNEDNFIFHICTAGWLWHEALFDKLDFITVDIKPPSSKTFSHKDVIDKIYGNYGYKSEFKMVVGNNEEDKSYAMDMIIKYEEADWTLQPLYISEVDAKGKDPQEPKDPYMRADLSGWDFAKFAEWVNEEFKARANVRMGYQLHKHIWPNKLQGI